MRSKIFLNVMELEFPDNDCSKGIIIAILNISKIIEIKKKKIKKYKDIIKFFGKIALRLLIIFNYRVINFNKIFLKSIL